MEGKEGKGRKEGREGKRKGRSGPVTLTDGKFEKSPTDRKEGGVRRKFRFHRKKDQ
jgi:hypothetical protein